MTFLGNICSEAKKKRLDLLIIEHTIWILEFLYISLSLFKLGIYLFWAILSDIGG